VFRRDDARGQTLQINLLGALEVRLSEKAVLLHERILSRHAVNEDVETLVGTKNAPVQGGYFALVGTMFEAIGEECGRSTSVGREHPMQRVAGHH
jgi:hypothetical protein